MNRLLALAAGIGVALVVAGCQAQGATHASGPARPVTAPSALGSLAAVPAASASAASRASASAVARPAATTSTTKPSASPVPPDRAAVSATLTGFPSVVAAGTEVYFTATLANHTTVDYADVAPLFQLVGGDCNCANGTLQRFDPASSTWQDAPMPEGDGYDPLTAATGGFDLPPGSSSTIRYRLDISANNTAKPAAATLYAVSMSDLRQLGTTATVATRISKP
jgi:hypothetical protein